ncbi:PIG-L family deacetylase [Actinokineospora sp. NBRC 105648]|uniref:PIG-L deacetylase family protein n=1 Tax=Actinokineospora sp. NBRC 105648 TaxID=3032206 RepID=UPI0024A17F05|nr:PIG-L family deacetylase [Actinokineospora sp. NBRC 105648]GLZ37898.1 PIG-L domain-containing protein [Actinokineospora sp. NBRC 105648]
MTTPAFTAPASVLTVMAHPDDAELWAGGTLALCANAGTTVTIAVPHHHKPTRDAEAAVGAAVLGADLRHYAQPTTSALHELLLVIRPEVVLTHPLNDVHPDHRHIAHAVLEALPDVVIATGHPRRLYTTDTYNSLTLDGPVPAHTIVDISTTWPTKTRALAAHASQPIVDHFGPMAENLARLWGARIGVTHAENFTPLPILGRLAAAAAL